MILVLAQLPYFFNTCILLLSYHILRLRILHPSSFQIQLSFRFYVVFPPDAFILDHLPSIFPLVSSFQWIGMIGWREHLQEPFMIFPWNVRKSRAFLNFFQPLHGFPMVVAGFSEWVARHGPSSFPPASSCPSSWRLWWYLGWGYFVTTTGKP